MTRSHADASSSVVTEPRPQAGGGRRALVLALVVPSTTLLVLSSRVLVSLVP